MSNKIVLLCLICLFAVIQPCSSQWGFTPEQVEVFDLVDETNVNFYEYLGVQQDASSTEIRRSYRKLSLTMHPDKNKTEGAEESFRILVAINEVLKSKEKREIYDNVLVNGLPSAYLYVPRQIRKMSMLEVSIIISLIFTVGHFLFIWGSFFERRLALEEMLPRLLKQQKKQKRKLGGNVDDESITEITNKFAQKPQMIDLLPILLLRKFYGFVVAIPDAIKQHKEQKKAIAQLEEEQKQEEELARKRQQEQIEKRSEAKRVKQERTKQKKEEFLLAKKLAAETAPSKPSVFENSTSIEELEAMYDEMDDETYSKKQKKSKNKLWDDEDQAELIKLTTKYPRGTTERWQKIAQEMGRSVQEVTARASQAKDYVGSKVKYSASTAVQGHKSKVDIPDNIITTRTNQENDDVSSAVTNTSSSNDESNVWDQSQQKLLEIALTQFPKSTPERWEKIALAVPNKTKDECIARYKFLATQVQQKRKQQS